MLNNTIDYEMTDALAAQAVREDCIASLREHVAAKDLLVVIGSTAVFALAVIREGHWLWWLAGLPIVIFVLLGLGWLFFYWWLPRAAIARLRRLPHRRVQVVASDEGISFRTAAELLEVVWGEVKGLKRRPNFWLVCLMSGTRIPVPVVLFPEQDVAFCTGKLTAAAPRASKAG